MRINTIGTSLEENPGKEVLPLKVKRTFREK
jgi:hypothetical protein